MVLCVDDEPHVLEGLRDVLHRSFDVRTAAGGAEGLEVLRSQPDSFAFVISDAHLFRFLTKPLRLAGADARLRRRAEPALSSDRGRGVREPLRVYDTAGDGNV
jgi:ActR/RegA family two-component response regulator